MGLSNKALAGLLLATTVIVGALCMQGHTQVQTCVWPHTCVTK